MPVAESYISALADRTGWTEGQILMFCGAAFLAGCATAIVVALRVTAAVIDARG
jgi:hypothetical protein